jgi:hypothetical protein
LCQRNFRLDGFAFETHRFAMLLRTRFQTNGRWRQTLMERSAPSRVSNHEASGKQQWFE